MLRSGRGSILDGQGEEGTTDEAKQVAWLTVEEATRQMPEAEQSESLTP